MARTQKFPEDLLLEAVVKYAETEKGKIKATELAAWAALNIKGLEGVRDYHFMRPVLDKNPKTGKKTGTRKKAKAAEIEEDNDVRETAADEVFEDIAVQEAEAEAAETVEENTVNEAEENTAESQTW